MRYASPLAALADPVRRMFKKPTPERCESFFLEVPEAALLLEVVRLRESDEGRGAIPYLDPVPAGFL